MGVKNPFDIAPHEALLDVHTKNLYERIRIGGYIEGLIFGVPDLFTLVANKLYGNPCMIARDITVDRITLEVTTSAAGSVRIGIYNMGTGDDLYPSSLVLDAGEVDVSGTEMKTITINQALPKGNYYLAYLSDVTPILRGARPIYTPLGRQEHAFSAYYKSLYIATLNYGVLPDPFTAGGTTSYNIMPIISIRVSSLD